MSTREVNYFRHLCLPNDVKHFEIDNYMTLCCNLWIL